MLDRNVLGKRIVEGDNNYWIRMICEEELIELGKKIRQEFSFPTKFLSLITNRVDTDHLRGVLPLSLKNIFLLSTWDLTGKITET